MKKIGLDHTQSTYTGVHDGQLLVTHVTHVTHAIVTITIVTITIVTITIVTVATG